MPDSLLGHYIAQTDKTRTHIDGFLGETFEEDNTSISAGPGRVEQTLNKVPFARGMFDMVNDPVGLGQMIPTKTTPSYDDPGSKTAHIAGQFADAFAPKGAFTAARKGVGRLVTNTISPFVYENKLKRLHEVLEKQGVRGIVRGAIEDRPVYEGGLDDIEGAREVPYRALFGLEPRTDEAKTFYKEIDDRRNKGVWLELDTEKSINNRMLKDVQRTPPYYSKIYPSNHPVMGGYTLQKNDRGNWQYYDKWDFALNSGEELTTRHMNLSDAIQGYLNEKKRKPGLLQKSQELSKKYRDLEQARMTRYMDDLPEDPELRRRVDEAMDASLEAARELQAVQEWRQKLPDPVYLQRVLLDKLVRDVHIQGEVLPGLTNPPQ